MPYLTALLNNNKQWSSRVKEEDPLFFERLEAIQKPDYLWIGCSDSRVPANQIVDLARTKAVQYAWDHGQTLGVHGWVYSIHDGLINDLNVTASSRESVDEIYHLHQTSRGNRPHANN